MQFSYFFVFYLVGVFSHTFNISPESLAIINDCFYPLLRKPKEMPKINIGVIRQRAALTWSRVASLCKDDVSNQIFKKFGFPYLTVVVSNNVLLWNNVVNIFQGIHWKSVALAWYSVNANVYSILIFVCFSYLLLIFWVTYGTYRDHDYDL